MIVKLNYNLPVCELIFDKLAAFWNEYNQYIVRDHFQERKTQGHTLCRTKTQSNRTCHSEIFQDIFLKQSIFIMLPSSFPYHLQQMPLPINTRLSRVIYTFRHCMQQVKCSLDP